VAVGGGDEVIVEGGGEEVGGGHISSNVLRLQSNGSASRVEMLRGAEATHGLFDDW
jgi:hypothetical protein